MNTVFLGALIECLYGSNAPRVPNAFTTSRLAEGCRSVFTSSNNIPSNEGYLKDGFAI